MTNLLLDNQNHNLQLLSIHLRRMMKIDEAQARQPMENVGLELEHRQVSEQIDQIAGKLGFGSLDTSLVKIVNLTELHSAYKASLEQQRSSLDSCRRILELQQAQADMTNIITITLTLEHIAKRLDAIERQLRLLDQFIEPVVAAQPSSPPPDPIRSVDDLLKLFKTIGDQPINLQERRAELSTFLKQLLRDSNRFSYADIHDIIIPDLGYSSGQFGRNPSFASLVNDLVDQAIADNKLNLLVKAICRLKPYLFGIVR